MESEIKINSLKDYQELCKRTANKIDDPEKEIMGWGLGVCGESGDLAGCIKKTIGHKNDQIVGVKENVGDTMWYLAMICNFYGWDMDEVLVENIEKLRKRYPEGFDFSAAQRGGTRVDWNEK